MFLRSGAIARATFPTINRAIRFNMRSIWSSLFVDLTNPARIRSAAGLVEGLVVYPEALLRNLDRAGLPELVPACWRNKPTGTTDVFGRLWWDRPAYTIRTEFYKPEKGRYLHPSAHPPITVREAGMPVSSARPSRTAAARS